MSKADERDTVRIGWAQADITPERPTLVTGQFHARVSEGVADPITATAWAFEGRDDYGIFVSCDLVTASDELRAAVRARLAEGAEGLDPDKVIMNATHTHTGPEIRLPRPGAGHTATGLGVGVELSVIPVQDYLDFAADRIAAAAQEAWRSRASGSFAFGLGHAVVGRNRRWVNVDGVSRMYGDTNTDLFSHIEGYEEHTVNALATYDESGELTGLVVNVPSPSQVTEGDYQLSADYWCETRRELRRRFGDKLPILAQCSAAGDQSPHLLYDKRAEMRMLDLKGRTEREEIGQRIADAVEEVLGCCGEERYDAPIVRHHVEVLDLPATAITEQDVRAADEEAEKLRVEYEAEKRKLEENPSLRETPRWYRAITRAFRRMRWFKDVARRFEMQKTAPTLPAEMHVIRLGDVAFATNPFEYYLDFGVFIKARSLAVQTFLTQLAGPGTYVPSYRSTSGGGYGSIPASNRVGPQGGRLFAERTVEILRGFWPEPDRAGE